MLICLAFLLSTMSITASASEKAATPSLKSISFKNAKITEEFSPSKHDYTLVLDDAKVTPTLDDYEIEGEANLFVNWIYDSTRHQTGAKVTLVYENGTQIYDFNYDNVHYYEENGNNYLRAVMCNLGVVYPEITNSTDDYVIFIPSDLTELEISAATQDVSAYCDLPKNISLTSEQELDIPIVVTASNGEKRVYSFSVKRTDKTCKEFTNAIRQGNTESLVRNEIFYQRPEFLIIVCSAAGALILILLLVRIGKRITIEVGDGDETEFFDAPTEETEE